MANSEADAPELYRRYRPNSFKQVVGQEAAIKQLVDMGKSGKIPHALLFTGPSGCGKTTIARILKDKLRCVGLDYCEINAAKSRGIDTVREVSDRMAFGALGGGSKIFYFDEAHQLTDQAQSSLLKMLEDTPKHVYFFLATTNPQKLLSTIKTRCTEIKLKLLTDAAARSLIAYVLDCEGRELSDAVITKVIEIAEGSARKALVVLNSVLAHNEESDQINAAVASDFKAAGINIARAIMDSRVKWPEISKMISTCEDDIEGVRRIILGYAKAVLLGDSKTPYKKRAVEVIQAFRFPWYDVGPAGLVAACWEVSGE